MGEEKQDRGAWLEARKSGIGASEFAALCGVSRWSSPYDIWAKKTGRSDDAPGEVTPWRFRRGHYMEAGAREEFLRHRMESARTYARFLDLEDLAEIEGARSFGPGLALFGETPMMATPDGVAEDDEGRILVEIKTAQDSARSEWEEKAPTEYWMQGQYAAAVLGVPRIEFVVVTWNHAPMFVEDDANPEFGKWARDMVEKWWRAHVEKDTPPEADGSAATNRFLKKMKRIDREARLPDVCVEVHAQKARLDQEIRSMRAKLKPIEDERQRCENMILAAMGDANVGVIPGFATYRVATINRKGYTVEPTSYQRVTCKEEVKK